MRENNKYTKTTWLQKLLWPGGCFSQENGIGIFLASIAFGYTQGTPWVSQTRLLALFEFTHQMRAVLEAVNKGFMLVSGAELATEIPYGIVLIQG